MAPRTPPQSPVRHRWLNYNFPMATTVRTPAHLSKAAKASFKRLVEQYHLGDEDHAVITLTLGLAAWDRAEEARRGIAKHGLVTPTESGGIKTNPLVAVERDSRLAAVRCLRELSLDSELDKRSEWEH